MFEAEARGCNVSEVLAERVARAAPPVGDYTVTLVQGVLDHWVRINEVLTTYAEGWTVERMPAVDRAVLRLGVYELLWGDVPGEVAISEAVRLVAELSTAQSPGFVNGLLARVRELAPSLSG